jgi:hypothetical protein
LTRLHYYILAIGNPEGDGNVKVAFKFLEPGERVPIGYKKTPIHMMFDVKMYLT